MVYDYKHCCYCGLNFEENNLLVTIEHVVPKSKGGRDILMNKLNCCLNCNRKKGDLFLENFLVIIEKEISKIKHENKFPFPVLHNKIMKYDKMIKGIKSVLEYSRLKGEHLFTNKYFYENYIDQREYVKAD